jgi:hypothetical protein
VIYRDSMTLRTRLSMEHWTAKTLSDAILLTLGGNQAPNSRPIGAHGPHGGGRPWLGRIGTMEKGLKRRFQPPEQAVRISPLRWTHNNPYG